jgi:NAD(P)-dependent dehydrogenase (short-subunit alcohol dehydrogenase family)
MTLPLTDRHAIVTGGARGIGGAVAGALARLGASLTLMGRDEDALQARAVELMDEHAVEVFTVRCDVALDESVTRAFAASRERYPSPWILVNNAGLGKVGPLMETSRVTWEEMLAVNLTGAWLCTREVWPAMLAAKGGRVVNIASVAGLRGFNGGAAYSAAKHGLVGLTRSLAHEGIRHGITVNAVCPAYTATGMAERAAGNVAAQRGIGLEEAKQVIARTVPMGRLIEPDEVAATVAWLCSAEASAVNGQAIVVAGGEA